MRFSVCIVYPSVLSLSNLKLDKTSVVENIFIKEKLVPRLTFNPGLALSTFRKTQQGDEMHSGSQKCLAQEYKAMSPAKARTRIALSGKERTKHAFTAKLFVTLVNLPDLHICKQ